MPSITDAQVSALLIPRGCTRIVRHIVNSKTWVRYVCSKGHINDQRWHTLARAGCKECGIQARSVPDARVVALLAALGYVCHDITVHAGIKYVAYTCDRGHACTQRWNSLQQGRRCLQCRSSRVRISESAVRDALKMRGCKFVGLSVDGHFSRVRYRCARGHIVSQLWSNLSAGRGCKRCSGLARRVPERLMRSAIAALGATFVASFQRDGQAMVSYICPAGHERTQLWGSVQQGSGCADCYTQKREITDAKARTLLAQRGYGLRALFWGADGCRYVEYECPAGHTHTQLWSNTQAGRGCKTCKGSSSYGERMVRQILEHATGLAAPKAGHGEPGPSWLGRLELDGYCAAKHWAFEFDGAQHFQSVVSWGGEVTLARIQRNDRRKNRLCRKHGVKLLRVRHTQFKKWLDQGVDMLVSWLVRGANRIGIATPNARAPFTPDWKTLYRLSVGTAVLGGCPSAGPRKRAERRLVDRAAPAGVSSTR